MGFAPPRRPDSEFAAARAAIASDAPIRVMDGDTLVGVVDEEDIMRVVVAEEDVR